MTTEDSLQGELARVGARLLNTTSVMSEVISERVPFPNNNRLPLLVYHRAVALPASDPAAAFELIFGAHGWQGLWRNGIYRFHHYHSTAHEVLGVYGGAAEVQIGGDGGYAAALAAGDVVVIPAGVAHKRLRASPDFAVVGAYPRGQRPDMNYGRPGERPRVDQAISRVALPLTDPVLGASGPLTDLWTC